VDENTGNVNNDQNGRTLYEESRNTYYGGGTAFIARTQHSYLQNKGGIYSGLTQQLEALKPVAGNNRVAVADYYVNPWQMGFTL
jgi:hypothetical protein